MTEDDLIYARQRALSGDRVSVEVEGTEVTIYNDTTMVMSVDVPYNVWGSLRIAGHCLGVYVPWTHAEYTQIKGVLHQANVDYYKHDAPKLSDRQYDILFDLVARAEKEHQGWLDSTSPTQIVGTKI